MTSVPGAIATGLVEARSAAMNSPDRQVGVSVAQQNN